MKDMKDVMEHKYFKMGMIRNVLFRAFLINYVAIFLAWLFSMTRLYDYLMLRFTWFYPDEAYLYIMNILGIWQTLGVVFMLFPALAIWWEMYMMKKRDK